MDLITLDLDYAKFKNERVSLSVVLISVLNASGLLCLPVVKHKDDLQVQTLINAQIAVHQAFHELHF